MLLGFKKRFALPIQTGIKIFTLRKRRRIEPKIGETLYMYTGLRTNKCKLISNKENLKGKQNVRIMIRRVPDNKGVNCFYASIIVDGRKLPVYEMASFYLYDGFDSMEDFCTYWLSVPGKKHLKKRTGALLVMYHWTDLKY